MIKVKFVIKAVERRFFRITKFDTGTYQHVKPNSHDVLKIRNQLIDEYFARQPKSYAVIIVRVYLLLKKIVKKLIKKALGRV